MDLASFSLILRINHQSYRINYFKGYEALSRNFYAKLILHLEKPWENPQILLAENASIEVTVKDKKRFFNGFIISLQHSPFPNQEGFYELKLKLSSWPRLFRDSDSFQIFENKTVLEILENLLSSYPQCSIDFSKLNKSYSAISYSVQYQESSERFMRRLLASAEIQSYFIHEETYHRLVLFDHPLFTPLELDSTRFWNWQTHYSLNSIPRFRVHSSYLELKLNTEFAYQKQNYRVIALKHEAYDLSHGNRSHNLPSNTQGYFNQCSLIKSEDSYPFRSLAKPLIPGVQTAFITQVSDSGASLAYPWSHQATTHSVPVLQVLADAEQNLQFLARTNTEALLGFVEGDPERPLILANCYHANQPPPFSPNQESWSSGFKNSDKLGSSEISFKDEPGSEQITIVTAQDFAEKAEQHTLLIQGDYQQKVGSHTHLELKNYELEASGLLFQAGQSLIKITADEIIIQSDSIELN